MDLGDWGLFESILMGALGLFLWLFKKAFESLQRSKEQFRENRLNVYLEVLDPMLTMMHQVKRKGRSGGKRGRGSGFSEDQFRRALVNVKLMATDEVVRALDDMITGFPSDGTRTEEESAEKLVQLFGGLLLAIRKDLGNPTTTMTELDMLRVIVTDVEQYYLKPSSDQ